MASPSAARPSVKKQNKQALSTEELRKVHAYWRAANFISVGQIYLFANPLLREPLSQKHVKPRLLGHWGTTPGLNFIYVHLNRLIQKHDLNVIYVAGPGHGGPALVANTYLEGPYSEVYGQTPQSDDRDLDSIFTTDKPVIFAYHGYPTLIHRLTYRRKHHANFHVHGYREEGTTTTPFDMTVLNELDRFHLAGDAADRAVRLQARNAHFKQHLRSRLVEHSQYVRDYGDDLPEICDWTWPY